jgi:HlyD family secretion protein
MRGTVVRENRGPSSALRAPSPRKRGEGLPLKLEVVVPGKKIPVRIVIAIVVLALAATGLLLYMREARKPKPLVLSGSLEARSVQVGSLVGGRVVRVLIDEGAHVTAGQLLVTLETETIDRQIAEQQAAVETAKAQLAKLVAGPRSEEISKAAAIAANDERERHRMDVLHRDGIVAKQLYEDAATKAKTSADDLRLLQKGSRPEDIAAARAQVEQAERRVATLMKSRAEGEVRSTVNGVVQSFGLRPGDLVAPDQPVAEILESDQLWVRVYVPETLLGLIHVGQPARVFVDTELNGQRQSYPGHVGTIASQGEYTPRNVQTRAQRAEQVFGVKVLVDPHPKLHAGMSADVDLGVKGRAE